MHKKPHASASAWKTGILFLLRSFIVVGAVVVVIGLIVGLQPQSVPFAMAMSGQSRLCSPRDVWQAGAVRVEMQGLVEKLRRSSNIVETDEAGYELWETPLGRFWTPSGSESAIFVLLAQQEVDQYGAVHGGVQPGEVVLDGGAHIGLYARKAIEQGARVVIAIEPAPVNVECLRRNLADEITAGKVIIYPKGIWDEEDELPLYEAPNNSAADSFFASVAASQARHTIPLTRIDTLVAELNLERIDRIKMDIKGATQRAIQGGEATIRSHRPHIVLSTEEDSDDPYAIQQQIQGWGLGYELGCGGYFFEGGLIEPDILHFIARN